MSRAERVWAGGQEEESPRCGELGNLKGAAQPSGFSVFWLWSFRSLLGLRCSRLEVAAGVFSASLSSPVLCRWVLSSLSYFLLPLRVVTAQLGLSDSLMKCHVAVGFFTQFSRHIRRARRPRPGLGEGG